MQFSIVQIVSAFMAFSVVSADLHENCACNNGDSYNWRITTAACEVYNNANYEWGSAVYDAPSGRCVQQTTEDKIAGDQWEEACQQVASKGFQCADGQGTCFADPDDVRGKC